MQIIQYDDQGKIIYVLGILNKCIKENKNGDICVVDFDVGLVLVMDRVGKFRFWYIGGIFLFLNDVLFCLVGIVIDSQVYILVLDLMVVYIVDKNGQFICFLNCDCLGLLWLVIDIEDNFYVVEIFGKVMMI